MAAILVLNGPNLQHLGIREPEHYGVTGLEDVRQRLLKLCQNWQWTLEFHQSNSESTLLSVIQSFKEQQFDYLIFNPAGLTHSSIVLRDALLCWQVPFIEVHVSNPFQRECFRRVSLFSDIAVSTISGCGVLGYELALQAVHHRLGSNYG